MAARGFLGAGDLYIARYNPETGQFGGYEGPFEATKFEIKPNTELKEMSSRGRSTYGQVIESVALQRPADFTVDLPEVNKQSLEIALLGSTSDVNQAAGSFTDLEVVAKLDAYVDMGKGNVVEAGFTVENETGDVTYVMGTDYVVNWRIGMIKALSTGSITEGQTLVINGTYNAVTGTKIAGGTNAQIRAKFRLDGVNFADQLPCIVDVHEGIIAADAAFDFLSEDFASVSLPGRMKTPEGMSEPFTVELRDTAS